MDILPTWAEFKSEYLRDRVKLVIRAIRRTGSISGASRLLDVDRKQIYRDLGDWGLTLEQVLDARAADD